MENVDEGEREPQAADAVLMIRPEAFSGNPQTAGSNFFQSGETGAVAQIAAAARGEAAALAFALAAAGVRVHVFDGRRKDALPDEVFPNNWLSLHADGTAVLFPLLAPNRRRERRPELIAALRDELGYRIARIVDLTHLERPGMFLEGTGSLVLDRPRRVAYACLSPRTHPEALAEFGRTLGYETVPFDAVDRAGRSIYHTNVMLALGTGFAALCTAAVADPAQRRRLAARLEASGREIVDLTFDQLHAFAGNLLELRGGGGRSVIVLSATALASLGRAQIRRLESYGELLGVEIGTIERYGGGSVRCMLAEVAAPRNA